MNAEEYENDENRNIFCPYCGLQKEKNEFYTAEVVEQANNIVSNYIKDELNKVFGKTSKSFNRSGIIQMKYKPLKKVNIENIKTKDSMEEQFKCTKCNKSVKVAYCDGKAKIFCSYCGEDIWVI